MQDGCVLECSIATSLRKQWNSANPDKKRTIDNFRETTNLGELMCEIAENELNFKSVDFTDLKKALSATSRGRQNGGTFMHPILFLCASRIVLSSCYYMKPDFPSIPFSAVSNWHVS